MNDSVIGIDLGGTNIKAGLFDRQGTVVREITRPTGDLAPRSVADSLNHIAGDLVGEAKGRWTIHAVGIGVPGGVTVDRRIVTQSPNFPGWIDVPLAEMVGKGVNAPVIIENDANSAALGETWLGAGRDVDSLALFTLGTGVGGGLVLDRRVWRGAWGMAGELGHITIDRNGPLCGCGNHGCLEAFARRDAIVERGRAIFQGGQSQFLRELSHNLLDAVTPESLYEAAKAGCAACREVLQDVGRYVGVAAATVLNVLNVRMVLIGGGIGGSYDILGPAVREEIQARAFRVPAANVAIGPALLGNRAGMVGAAATAWDLANSPVNGDKEKRP
jgi:glucokinase